MSLTRPEYLVLYHRAARIAARTKVREIFEDAQEIAIAVESVIGQLASRPSTTWRWNTLHNRRGITS